MAGEIDYAAVLADMEAKRTALDSAIAGIRQWLSLGGSSDEGSAGTPLLAQADRKPDSPEVKFDTFFGLSIPDAIRKFLTMTKRPQSVSDITKALQEGGLTTTSMNLLSTVGSTLSRLKQTDGDLVSVQGKWGLREWYPGMRDEKVAKTAKSKGSAHKRRRPKREAPANAPKSEPKTTGVKASTEQIERINALHAAGKKPGEIAKEVDLHHFVVMAVLKAKESPKSAVGEN